MSHIKPSLLASTLLLVRKEKRREKLTFCLIVSYTIVALLGYQVQKTGRASIVSSYGKSSITWLGIGIVNHRKLRRRHFLIRSDVVVIELLTKWLHDNK